MIARGLLVVVERAWIFNYECRVVLPQLCASVLKLGESHHFRMIMIDVAGSLRPTLCLAPPPYVMVDCSMSIAMDFKLRKRRTE